MNRYKLGKGVLIIVFICILSSCTIPQSEPETLIGDGGLLTTTGQCNPPCLWGIVPGVTVEAEVVNILIQRNVTHCEKTNKENMEGIESISCSPGPYIGFIPNNDIVEIISFIPSTEITVEDVIEIRGYPTAITVSVEGNQNQKPYASMFLYYDELSTILYLGQQEGQVFNVEPTSIILSINYSDQAFYEFRRNDQNIILWKGYGEYHSLPYIDI